MKLINQLVVLDKKNEGCLVVDDLKVIERPVREIKEGEVLLKTLYFSIDPYMKKIMRTSQAYAEFQNTSPDEPIQGGAICVVEQSKNPNLPEGELVLSYTGWQKYAVSKGNLTPRLPWDYDSVKIMSPKIKPTYYLGVLGMAGLAGYSGITNIGQPKAGETVIITSAAGTVGTLVGQYCKEQGCRVIGVVGGEKKCKFVLEQLNFDACLDLKSPTFTDDLNRICPEKIDIFFDNIGGEFFYKILEYMNEYSRVCLCGSMAWVNQADESIPLSPDILALIYFSKIPKRIKLQSYLVLDYLDTYDEFLNQISPLILADKIEVIENIVQGIEKTPQAFLDMLNGNYLGKVVIEP